MALSEGCRLYFLHQQMRNLPVARQRPNHSRFNARISMPRLIALLRQANWLTHERVVAWGVVLLVQELLLLSFIALWLDGFAGAVTTPSANDFVSFYAAGKLTLAGTPALAYNQAAHYWAEQQATAPGVSYIFFFYPPVFLFLCAGFAKLPYYVAYVLFQSVTLGLFVGVMRGILREKGWTWILPILAFPAVLWTIGQGQNAFLTATLFGAATLLIDRRPITAGLLLGLLCYKPHFGLLIPIAFAAGRHWRAFIAASLTIVVLIGLSIVLFGWETWQAYFTAFAGSSDTYTSGRVALAGMVTPFGGALLLGFDMHHAYVVQAITTLTMVALIALIWRRGVTRALRSASLLAATLLAVPLALVYDELLMLVAIAWIVREARARGFLPWEKILLAAIYPLSLLTWTAGRVWHVPLGPVIGFIVLLLCLRRVRRIGPWLARPGGVITTRPDGIWRFVATGDSFRSRHPVTPLSDPRDFDPGTHRAGGLTPLN
jgi:alpha-1,2-mannosyltransferase